MIPQTLYLMNDMTVLYFFQTFRNPTNIYNPSYQGYDFILRGMFTDPSQTVDNFVSCQVSKLLFTENFPTQRSMDLIAMNIQRGRDHGLPGIK